MTKYQELYAWYKSIRICPQCGTNTAAPNRVRCEECLIKNAESSEKQRMKKTEALRKESQNARINNMRQKRKENGLCIWCGKPICSKSAVFCIDCKIKNQRKNEQRKSEIARCERPDYGFCYTCGNPIDRKGRVCKKCAETMNANLPKDRDNVNWRNDNKLIFGNRG